MRVRPWRMALCVAMVSGAVACDGDIRQPLRAWSQRPLIPDEAPSLISTELPFRYPASLYARRVQGNVTLRLFVDDEGHVVTDSTRVEEPSGNAALDSAAIAGARDLRFAPAKRQGEAMPTSILFPVYFRHPEARPLPGDTILTAAGKAG